MEYRFQQSAAPGHEAIIEVSKSTHHKCGRCWRLLPDVAEEAALCGRCEDVVAVLDTAA